MRRCAWSLCLNHSRMKREHFRAAPPPPLHAVHTGDLQPRIEGGVIVLYWLRTHSGPNHSSLLIKTPSKRKNGPSHVLCDGKHTHGHFHTPQSANILTMSLFLLLLLGMFPSEMLLFLSDMTNYLPPLLSLSSFLFLPPFCSLSSLSHTVFAYSKPTISIIYLLLSRPVSPPPSSPLFPGLQDRFPQE